MAGCRTVRAGHGWRGTGPDMACSSEPRFPPTVLTSAKGAMSDSAAHYEKLAAVKAAERVFGVRTVAVEIRVEIGGASVIPDEEIAETIARQLQWNTVVPDTVEAEVENGFVTLRGTVEWSYQREAAEHPVNLVRGICGVTNLITIQPHVKLSADLAGRVHEAIARMADLDARSIGIAARDGTAWVLSTRSPNDGLRSAPRQPPPASQGSTTSSW